MLGKERFLAGMGITVSALGVMGTAAAVSDMLMDPRPGIHWEKCEHQSEARIVPCLGNLAIPESVMPELGELAVGLGLLSLGATAAILNNRKIHQQYIFNDEWFRWQKSCPEYQINKTNL